MPRYGYRRRRGYQTGDDPYILMMLMLLLQKVADLPYKPPVTVVFIVGQYALYFLPSGVSIFDICLYPGAVLYGFEIHRLLLANLFHVDAVHLYYNLSSFLGKGVLLERRLGSSKFASMILFFMVASSVFYTGIALAVYALLGEQSLMETRAVGFSAVLFALKVVLHVRDEGEASLLGITLPSKYMYWMELLMIRLLVPNSSFLGHFSGILAGLVYVYLEANGGNLSVVPRWLTRLLNSPETYFNRSTSSSSSRSRRRRPEHRYEQPWFDISQVDINDQKALYEEIQRESYRDGDQAHVRRQRERYYASR